MGALKLVMIQGKGTKEWDVKKVPESQSRLFLLPWRPMWLSVRPGVPGEQHALLPVCLVLLS